MKLLLVDNHDSFVYNIFQMIRVMGHDPVVIQNDGLGGIEENYDRVILSPGPGNPENSKDSGELFQYLRNGEYGLVLGICFGHQALGKFLGSSIKPAPSLMHGEIDAIVHNGGTLFNGVPREFRSVRYHSLVISHSQNIVEDAVSASDGSMMAFHSRNGRFYGVQFHPESFYSEFGNVIVRNFLEATDT